MAIDAREPRGLKPAASGGEDAGGVAKALNSSALPDGSRKHCGLFSDLSRKADARLDHEVLVGGAQPVGWRVPVLPSQNHAEMGDGYGVAVDGIVARIPPLSARWTDSWWPSRSKSTWRSAERPSAHPRRVP